MKTKKEIIKKYDELPSECCPECGRIDEPIEAMMEEYADQARKAERITFTNNILLVLKCKVGVTDQEVEDKIVIEAAEIIEGCIRKDERIKVLEDLAMLCNEIKPDSKKGASNAYWDGLTDGYKNVATEINDQLTKLKETK